MVKILKIVILKKKSIIPIAILIVLAILLSCLFLIFNSIKLSQFVSTDSKGYIKWVDFNVPYKVLSKTMNVDIKSYKSDVKLNWIELLSFLACKYGGNFSRYKEKDLNSLVEKLSNGSSMEELTLNMKHYSYFLEAYNAVLSQFVGDYQIQVKDPNDSTKKVWESRYGLKAFSPVARGYSFGHYDDFGDSRSFGYKRKHLGNDLMGNVGTPIIAIESGTVEVMGWNIYGGWRIGIRSFDKKRYYYYAHLRRTHPYNNSLTEGKVVKAGDVIGYLGMTGYSTKEGVNNIKTPHLHFGMQLIFDEVQKEGVNQIWIDVYNIIELLKMNKSSVVKDPITKDYSRVYDFKEPSVENYKPIEIIDAPAEAN